MNVGWTERNQQDATNLMFIVKLLPQTEVIYIYIYLFIVHVTVARTMLNDYTPVGHNDELERSGKKLL